MKKHAATRTLLPVLLLSVMLQAETSQPSSKRIPESYLLRFENLNSVDLSAVERACDLRFRSCIADGTCIFLPRDKTLPPSSVEKCLQETFPSLRSVKPRYPHRLRLY